MVGTTSNWEDELRGWLKPFVDRLGHKSRRRMCPLYVAGLIGPAIARAFSQWRSGLRLVITTSCIVLLRLASGTRRHWRQSCSFKRIGSLVAATPFGIDDTAVPKKGTHSVGVAAQYASALGKTANCGTPVSLTLARGEVPVMVALRLFLPDSWVNDRRRLKRAGVPAEY